MPGRLGGGQPGANLSAYLDRLEKRPARERAVAKSPSPAVVSRAPSRVDSGADPGSNRCIEAVPGKAT